MPIVNELSEEAKLESAPLLESKLEELLRSEWTSKKQSSQAIQELCFIRDDLDLYSTVDAISVSARIAALLLSEIKKGGSITVKYKSGVSSKITIN